MPLVQTLRLPFISFSGSSEPVPGVVFGKSRGDSGVAGRVSCGLWLRGGQIEQPADY